MYTLVVINVNAIKPTVIPGDIMYYGDNSELAHSRHPPTFACKVFIAVSKIAKAEIV